MRRGSFPSALSLLLVLLFASVSSIDAQDFRRGDVDGDGVAATMGDVATFMPVMLSGNFPCQDAADIDDNGVVNIADLSVLLGYVGGQNSISAPGVTNCGPDPTPDNIGCDTYTSCVTVPGLPFSTDYAVSLSSVTGSLGVEVELPVVFDNFAGDQVHAVSISVCQSPFDLTLVDVDLGSHFAGNTPDFFDVRTQAGAWDLTLLTSILACGSCPLSLDGLDQEIAVARYVPQAEGTLPVEFCSGVFVPNTPNSIGVADLVIFSAGFEPLLVDGGIESVSSPAFRRGDANRDTTVNIADPIFILSALFSAGDLPSCLDAADANDDAKVDIADPVTILSVLFAGLGPLLPAPNDCGVDPTEDTLGCDDYPECP